MQENRSRIVSSVCLIAAHFMRARAMDENSYDKIAWLQIEPKTLDPPIKMSLTG